MRDESAVLVRWPSHGVNIIMATPRNTKLSGGQAHDIKSSQRALDITGLTYVGVEALLHGLPDVRKAAT